MTEREIFSVQNFFDQLILVYDNFQSMEIAAEKLNKMKQKNKQPFSAFISGFEKKMLETGGMDFNDQVTKTFLLWIAMRSFLLRLFLCLWFKLTRAVLRECLHNVYVVTRLSGAI